MKEIRAEAKNLRALLGAAKYAVDYYQREYNWQTKHIEQLLVDLDEKFFEFYQPEDDRTAVETYGHYFLGSIIVSEKDGSKYIIDGQQRLTSLTLLLIHIHHALLDPEQKRQLAELIFSQKYGQRSFNLNVSDRNACMEALYTQETFDENGQPTSVSNIIGRYQDIKEKFPDRITPEIMPYFADWLIENVHIVEITAYSDQDAYTIFETMNDRGLSLSPADMLKGYLLANITDTEKRTRASQVWTARIRHLITLGKDEDVDGIKSWLRSQYANSIRERKRDAAPQDFDLIGTEFHRWVKDHEDQLGLAKSDDYFRFVDKNFSFYARQYQRLREAAETLTEGLEAVYYNASQNFTLQYTALLAPLRADDSDDEILRKIRITAAYLDILIARRIWNWKSIDYSTMQYAMFLVVRDIRGLSSKDLAVLLRSKLDEQGEEPITFATNPSFHLHGMNGRQIHRLLARMTDYIEVQSGQASRFTEYVQRQGKNGYEVEHIWANHPERHKDEFEHSTDFDAYRNRFGGLLLLPKSFNASYGDLPYPEKRQHYLKQNLLAQSLHEEAYKHNPGFNRFIDASGLPFKALPAFKRTDMDDRQGLYQKIAEMVWSPERITREVI